MVIVAAMENKFSSFSLLVTSPLPVPTLNREEDESCDDEVRALAAALAPSILETEEILQVPLEFRTSTDSATNNGVVEEYDDDDLDEEVDALRSSEALLRQELEMAQDFSSLFQFTQILANEGDINEDTTKVTSISVVQEENSDPIPDNVGPDCNHDVTEDIEAIGTDEILTPIKLKQNVLLRQRQLRIQRNNPTPMMISFCWYSQVHHYHYDDIDIIHYLTQSMIIKVHFCCVKNKTEDGIPLVLDDILVSPCPNL